MAKRFFFTAMGILALAAAYHLGAVRTEAQDSHGTSPILFMTRDGGDIWDHEGLAWTNNGSSWARVPELDLPFPVSDVAVYESSWVTTGSFAMYSGDVWWCNTSSKEWNYRGQFSGGPISNADQSFGTLKSMFRR